MANLKDIKTCICIAALLLITGMFSCTKNDEELPIPDKYEEVEVNLYLTIPAARQITYSETKAEQENISFTLGTAYTRSGEISEIEQPSIDNLWVLQFDDNQTLIRKSYQNMEPEKTSSILICMIATIQHFFSLPTYLTKQTLILNCIVPPSQTCKNFILNLQMKHLQTNYS